MHECSVDLEDCELCWLPKASAALTCLLCCAALLQAAEALRRQHAEEAARLAEEIAVLDRSEKRLLTSQALLEAREGELAASVQQLQARWVGGAGLWVPSLLARYSR